MTFCYFSCLGRYYFGPHLWQFSAHWPSLADLKGCLIWLNLLNEWDIFSGKIFLKPRWQSKTICYSYIFKSIQVCTWYWILSYKILLESSGRKKCFFMFKAKLVAEHVGSMSTQPTPAAHNGLKSFSEGTLLQIRFFRLHIFH